MLSDTHASRAVPNCSYIIVRHCLFLARYLELQETVRWMGMMQAERSKHPDLNGTTAGGAFNSAADQRKVPNSGDIWKLLVQDETYSQMNELRSVKVLTQTS